MLVIQCLLGAIAVVLVAGFGVVAALLREVRETQRSGDAAMLRYLRDLLGAPLDGDAARMIEELRDFLKAARQGRIPSLRRDGWQPPQRADRAFAER